MSASKCARCDKTVYPVEGLRCLDKVWHKGCFKCHECNMTLNMKNYKGFEKTPYCNAHCPQAKATTVADTPEIRRLAENTRLQSQAKYHEDFEKSKGKGFTTILDDPEMRRIKETSKIISNVAYHGDIEKKKKMEQRRNSNGQEDKVASINNNNNTIQHQNNMQSSNNMTSSAEHVTSSHQNQQYQQQQRLLHHQQHQMHQHQQQQQYIHKQQMLKQQHNALNRQSAPVEGYHEISTNQRSVTQQQQYPVNNQTQQQLIVRQQQQQQQQQQQIMMQQYRQSMNGNIPISRQVSKQAVSANNQSSMNHPNIVQTQNQTPIKFVPFNDSIIGQPSPQQFIGMQQHIINNSAHISPIQQQNNRRAMPNSQQPMSGMQQVLHNYGPDSLGSVNGILPNQSAASMGSMPLHQHMVAHSEQIRQLQMRPATYVGQPIHQQVSTQVPRRVFRAMYDYVANDVDEVSFFENDILVDCVNVDRNWLIGKVARSGQTGMLPANYVAELPSH